MQYKRRLQHRAFRRSRRIEMLQILLQRRITAILSFLFISNDIFPPRSIWQKRSIENWWENVLNGFRNKTDFRENFRLSKETFKFLCMELEKRNTNFRQSITVKKGNQTMSNEQILPCRFFLTNKTLA